MNRKPKSSVRILMLALLLSSLASFPSILHARGSRGVQKTREVPVVSLIYDLKNPDPERRKEAAKLLGDNKVKRATPDLVAAAKDPVADVRREIVNALDKMADIRALPAFIELSSDPEKDIREKCVVSLVNLYLPVESGITVTITKVANFLNPWSDEWAETVVEPYVPVDAGANEALRKRLQDSDAGIRAKAARGLGILKGREAVPALVDTLRRDQSNSVRFEVVRALRKIGDTSVAGDLMNYINYNDKKVRHEAIYALGRFRSRRAAPELMRLYDKAAKAGDDEDYRETLLDALAFIADPDTQGLFTKEMRNPNDKFRLHAVEGLARIADASLVTEISRARLHEENEKVRTAEAYALFRMGRREYLDEVVAALGNGETSEEAKQYLVELRPEDRPELYQETRNTDVAVREGLAEVIGLIGDSRAVPVLQELSKDTRGQISAYASQALRRLNARANIG